MRFYGEIARVDDEARMVWGYASTRQPADDGQTIARAALEAALDEYMAFANIREMHQRSAVGVAREASVDEEGLYIGAHIVDAAAWDKVKAGVYRGFSIGAKVTERDTADRTIVRGLKLIEISLVDRPCDPGAVFDVWRAATAGDDDRTTAERDGDDVTAAHTLSTEPDPSVGHGRASRHRRGGEGCPGHPRLPQNETKQDVDARNECGHDDREVDPSEHASIPDAPSAETGRGADAGQGGARTDATGALLTRLARLARRSPQSAAVADSPDELSRVVATLAHDRDSIRRGLDGLARELGALAARVEALAVMPLPPKTIARAVAKEEDARGRSGAPPSDEDIRRALDAMPAEERALLLTRAALSRPIPLTR